MAFCRKCGASIKEKGLFCPKCGLKLREIKESVKKVIEEPKPYAIVKEAAVKEEAKPKLSKKVPTGEFGNRRSLTIIGLAILIGIVIVIVLVAVRGPTYYPTYQPPRYEQPSYEEPSYGKPTETVTPPSTYEEGEEVKTYCGDDSCDAGETMANCCLDCGCPLGYECNKAENKCAILMPKIEAEYETGTSKPHSATVLYAVPEEIINQEKPLIVAKIRNTGEGTAKSVQLKAKLGEYSDWTTKNLGDLNAGELNEVKMTPRADSKILSLTTHTNVPISFQLSYRGADDKEYLDEQTKEIEVLGRNSVTLRGAEAAWITSEDPVIRDFAAEATAGLSPAQYDEEHHNEGVLPAVERIIDEVAAFGVRYVSDPNVKYTDYNQFPVETLHRKGGDCDDTAILFAALLRAVGISAGLVYIPGHAFTWYEMNGVKYVLDGTGGSKFFHVPLEEHLKRYNQSYIENPDRDYLKGIKMVNLPDPPLVNVPNINIHLDADENSCSLGLGGKWYSCRFNVIFSNTGGQGHRCVIVYNNEKGTFNKKDEEKICTDVPTGESSKQVELDADYGKEYTFDYYVTNYGLHST